MADAVSMGLKVVADEFAMAEVAAMVVATRAMVALEKKTLRALKGN